MNYILNNIENGIKGKSFSSAAAFARWLTIFTQPSKGGTDIHNVKDERQSKNDVGNDALDSRQ